MGHYSHHAQTIRAPCMDVVMLSSHLAQLTRAASTVIGRWMFIGRASARQTKCRRQWVKFMCWSGQRKRIQRDQQGTPLFSGVPELLHTAPRMLLRAQPEHASLRVRRDVLTYGVTRVRWAHSPAHNTWLAYCCSLSGQRFGSGSTGSAGPLQVQAAVCPEAPFTWFRDLW